MDSIRGSYCYRGGAQIGAGAEPLAPQFSHCYYSNKRHLVFNGDPYKLRGVWEIRVMWKWFKVLSNSIVHWSCLFCPPFIYCICKCVFVCVKVLLCCTPRCIPVRPGSLGKPAPGMDVTVCRPEWIFFTIRLATARSNDKKLSWCSQTRATRLEVNQGHQTWYHSIC